MTEPPIDEALLRLRRAIGRRYGLVRAVDPGELLAGDPPVAVAFSHPGGVIGGEGAVNEGGGAALDPRVAQVKAIAETIERYCASVPGRANVFASWEELDEPAVSPRELALFSDEQHAAADFPFAPFDTGTAVTWEHGRRLLDGAALLVPSAFVSLPHRRAAGEPRVTTAISTGLAAALSPEAALRSALLEVVERDAFMLTWRHRRVPAGIDLGSLTGSIERRLLAALRATGLSCHAVLLTQDLEIPVVAVVLRGTAPHHPHLVVGAGASPWPIRAVRLALEEACLSLFGMNRLMRTAREHGYEADATTLTGQSVEFAVDAGVASCAAFLTAASPSLDVAELQDRFASLESGTLAPIVDALGDYRTRAVGVDLTAPEVRDLGLHVTRVLVPGLRPLDHDATIPHLGGDRWLAGTRHLDSHPFP